MDIIKVDHSRPSVRQRIRRRAIRSERRSQLAWRIFVVIYLAFQIAVGGATGILIGALLLNWISPGHPIYVAIRDWVRALLGI